MKLNAFVVSVILAAGLLGGCTRSQPRITYECGLSGDQKFDSVEDARLAQSDTCRAYVPFPLTDREKAAIVAAYGDEAKQDEIYTLYGICAQAGKTTWEYLRTANADQVREVTVALTLCPDHPDKAVIDSAIGDK